MKRLRYILRPDVTGLDHAPGLNPQHEERWYRDRRWKRKNRDLLSAWSDVRGTVAQLDALGAILLQIEEFVPDDFSSANALRAFLINVARGTFSVNDNSDIEVAKNKERALFQSYIKSLSEDDLRAIAPLPYRRVLSKHELATIWQRVEQRWGITAKMDWYPLHDVPLPSHVIALQEDWFAYAIPPDVLREILIQHGILRVWELSQGDVSSQYEMDVTWLVPWSSAVEHCWTSERMDWMIYTSHEHSITLGGEWFLERIKYMWPEWKEHIYAGYRYALPPPFESSNLAPLLQFRSTSTSAEQAGL